MATECLFGVVSYPSTCPVESLSAWYQWWVVHHPSLVQAQQGTEEALLWSDSQTEIHAWAAIPWYRQLHRWHRLKDNEHLKQVYCCVVILQKDTFSVCIRSVVDGEPLIFYLLWLPALLNHARLWDSLPDEEKRRVHVYRVRSRKGPCRFLPQPSHRPPAQSKLPGPSMYTCPIMMPNIMGYYHDPFSCQYRLMRQYSWVKINCSRLLKYFSLPMCKNCFYFFSVSFTAKVMTCFWSILANILFNSLSHENNIL